MNYKQEVKMETLLPLNLQCQLPVALRALAESKNVKG